MRRLGVIGLLIAAGTLGACTSGATGPVTRSATPTMSTSASTAAPTSSAAPSPSSTSRRPPSTTRPAKTTPRTRATTRAATPSRSGPAAAALPLDYPTGSARQVVTVTAGATSDTQATLQAWQRSGSGWTRVGSPVPAWLGTAGMTDHPSEQNSATPMGSFTLTQAFGHDANPGTRLPYTRTTPADWWISQPGPLYNTLQRCSSNCSFTQGDPNEHLFYETPYYDYAMVIDYNRAPVRQGAGSAFFVHVTVGEPTAGCVSIARDRLVDLMRWIRPSAHPRILIGLG